jgi:hypothetical protein
MTTTPGTPSIQRINAFPMTEYSRKSLRAQNGAEGRFVPPLDLPIRASPSRSEGQARRPERPPARVHATKSTSEGSGLQGIDAGG